MDQLNPVIQGTLELLAWLLIAGQLIVLVEFRKYLRSRAVDLLEVTRATVSTVGHKTSLSWRSWVHDFDTEESWPRRDVQVTLDEPLERLIYQHVHGAHLPPFESVLLAGPFNDWGKSATNRHHLTEGCRGRWSSDFRLPDEYSADSIEFKFVCTCQDTGQVVWLTGISDIDHQETGTLAPDGMGGLNTKRVLNPYSRVQTVSDRYVSDLWSEILSTFSNHETLALCFPEVPTAKPHLRLTHYREMRGFQGALDDLKAIQERVRLNSDTLRPTFESVRSVSDTLFSLVLSSTLPSIGLLHCLLSLDFSQSVLPFAYTVIFLLYLVLGVAATIFSRLEALHLTTPKTTALDIDLERLAIWPSSKACAPVGKEGEPGGAKVRFFWYTDPGEAFSGEYSDETCLQVAAGAERLYAVWIELYGKWFFDAFLWLQSIGPGELTRESKFHFWIEDWVSDPPLSIDGDSILPAEKLEAAHLHRKAVLGALVSLERRLCRAEKYGVPSWDTGVSRERSMSDLVDLERRALKEGLSIEPVPPFSYFEEQVLARRKPVESAAYMLPMSLDEELDQMADRILVEEGVHYVTIGRVKESR